jgi:hypothetical protein
MPHDEEEIYRVRIGRELRFWDSNQLHYLKKLFNFLLYKTQWKIIKVFRTRTLKYMLKVNIFISFRGKNFLNFYVRKILTRLVFHNNDGINNLAYMKNDFPSWRIYIHLRVIVSKWDWIVLHCFDGMVIAVQYTATFSRSIVLPRI